MNTYKCAMCGNNTDWDSSYGRDNFIICPHCHKKLTNLVHGLRKSNCMDMTIVTEMILAIGFTREGVEIV